MCDCVCVCTCMSCYVCMEGCLYVLVCESLSSKQRAAAVLKAIELHYSINACRGSSFPLRRRGYPD